MAARLADVARDDAVFRGGEVLKLEIGDWRLGRRFSTVGECDIKERIMTTRTHHGSAI